MFVPTEKDITAAEDLFKITTDISLKAAVETAFKNGITPAQLMLKEDVLRANLKLEAVKAIEETKTESELIFASSLNKSQMLATTFELNFILAGIRAAKTTFGIK